MSEKTKHFYAFGPFRLDSEKRVLVRDAAPVPLAPKVVCSILVISLSQSTLEPHRSIKRGAHVLAQW
jgi:hypothetical protein